MWVPYTVTHEYDVHYVLEDVRRGTQYSASVQGADETQVEIFLLLTLPIAFWGHNETIAGMADQLYQQFVAQGAFVGDGNPIPLQSGASAR